MANPWDVSNILLSNQSGANIARGIDIAGQALGRGIERFGQRQEENNRFMAKAKGLESFIKAHAEDFGADPKQVLAIDPSESPAARYERLSTTVENVVLDKKLKQAQQEMALQKQQIEQNRFLQMRQMQNAEALRNAFMSPGSAQQALRNYAAAGGVPDSATSQMFNAALDAEAMAINAGKPTQRYRNTGPVMDKSGKPLGYGAFDQATGQVGMVDEEGNFSPLPEGAEPVTATGLQKQVPSINEFRKMKSDLTDAEISLRNMSRYIKSVGDANQGIERLADKFSAGIKTLVGEKKLNPQEVAAKMAQGQLQGLLGANRTNVVGGGVMTEQDALRIIERLGGDFGALSNKEIVKQAISQVYSDRYKQYEDAFNFYNAAVQDYYGSRGFKSANRVDYQDFTAEQPAETAPAKEEAPLSIKSIKLVE